MPVQHDEGRLGAVADDEGVKAVRPSLDHAALVGGADEGEDARLGLFQRLGGGGGGEELEQAEEASNGDGRNGGPTGKFGHD